MVIVGFFLAGGEAQAREVALTFDDAPTPDSALMTGEERTQKIIAALKQADVPDALFFVKADYINPQTAKRLAQYTTAGFHLANHSFSHQSANKIGVTDYAIDAYKAHLALKPYDNVLSFHRFPYLHYGESLDEVNLLQQHLTALGYSDGYVTADNFDWYISALINRAAENGQTIDYPKARDFYVNHLLDTLEFYDGLAQERLNRSPRHLLLLHENDAAALFVGDLIAALRSRGWKIISPQRAYKDPVARHFPQTAFHKQGRIAAIAHHQGVAIEKLRHPSENEQTLSAGFIAAGIAAD